MSLVRFEEVSLEFGDQPILTTAELSIEPGERVCLIGRNGAGKSSTLKLISGEIEPDHGEVHYKPHIVISQLAQELPEAHELQVREVVKSGLADAQGWMDEYQAQSQRDLDQPALQALEELHRRIDSVDGWHIEQRVDAIVSELNLPAEKFMHELSGGWRRRVALARALVRKPDLLLLDEPTNHLDLVTINWLEDTVRRYSGSVLFITHDRAFLQSLATRILEIDRGQLTSWPGNYANYLVRKEKALEDEALENARFDKKLAQEEVWIRQGIKARRTRNEGRARALKAMREERGQRLSRSGQARIHIEEAEKSGRKIVELRNVSHEFGDQKVIQRFSTKIMRGDRIGLLGNNGVGKSTLLRIVLGELTPQEGVVKHGSNLVTGYFDQLRRTLDPDKTVAETVGDGRDYINLLGKDRHIIGYLRGFLFSSQRATTPIKALSGGERNRVILAKLFTQPVNLLVLDEPTNDLDMETLEILEDRLIEYKGTLIVVSHDRAFLDNVVTSTLVFESGGSIQEYVGGYADWLRQNKKLAETENPNSPGATAAVAATRTRNDKPPTKLSYNEQRELGQLPAKITSIEENIARLESEISQPGFYDQEHEKVQEITARFANTQVELETAMTRWMELEERQQELSALRNESS